MRALCLALAAATPQKQPAQQTVTCLSQTKNILAVTDFAPQQFAYMNHATQTFVYTRLDNDQVTSLTSVFFITQKDCSKGPSKSVQKNGNVFVLTPFEPGRSVLITEGAFMRESSDYVLSLEVQSGNIWK